MKELDAQQLAFILDIKKGDARAKMCVAWANHRGEDNKATWNHTGTKVDDPYPKTMPIELLAKELNLPTLQRSVDDIVNNYLVRPATRKWILCDYPEQQIRKHEEAGTPKPVRIPPALRSMLRPEIMQEILKEWQDRHNISVYTGLVEKEKEAV